MEYHRLSGERADGVAGSRRNSGRRSISRHHASRLMSDRSPIGRMARLDSKHSQRLRTELPRDKLPNIPIVSPIGSCFRWCAKSGSFGGKMTSFNLTTMP
jgi:hypothetical protein